MNGYKQRPEPATRAENTHFIKIYKEIEAGHKVNPRYIESAIKEIQAKLLIAETFKNESFREDAQHEMDVVTAYQNRGTQAEVLAKAAVQKRLAEIYRESGQTEFANRAIAKSKELLDSWMAYQIESRF